MLYRSMFPQDVFAQMNRLQREMQDLFDFESGIRGMTRGSFPAINLGATPHSVEMYLFAPGLDPSAIEVNLERGVLTVSGERKDSLATQQQNAAVHINERFAGQFRRVVSLPDDIDPDGVAANYRDGVLHVSIRRREEAQPRRISVH
ncbi:HSP20 family protein [Noviherbaspirillum humi]|uniref:HSP20 family protein n=1 Tax=Noviherbaspirillum humi TaxID=1688639 RepID=A0A239F824_9BURK|nr:Hsp20/alpha crystallin family protein [Noviherbaspirillum humi]SNS52463.1 HSP20 family protein [Noviherbaspirillum humi]